MIKNEEVNDYVRTYMGDAEFCVIIVPNQQVPLLDISDLSQYQAKKALFEEDRTLRTFLEMAITQFSINKFVLTNISLNCIFPVIFIRRLVLAAFMKCIRIINAMRAMELFFVRDLPKEFELFKIMVVHRRR
jgi:hypothetical protein